MTAMAKGLPNFLVNPLPLALYRWRGGLIVDNFAGGGGASTGIFKALGVSPDIAVNHDAEALAMHAANHPETKHYNESVWDIDIRQATGGRPVLFGWFSPDCTHFSVAKGGKPVKKAIRGLAWVVKKWAGQSDMAIFGMENVKEFQTWGPLVAKRGKHGRVLKLVPTDRVDKKGNQVFDEVEAAPGEYVPYREQALTPDKGKAYGSKINQLKHRRKYARHGAPVGRTFRDFCAQMREMGYALQFNDKAVAYDYGDGTSRRRLVGFGRKDGLPLSVNPAATHGKPDDPRVLSGQMKPWVTAGERLDFSLECPSIFGRAKPLAERTMERIAKGIERFVLNAGDDAFIVKANQAELDLQKAMEQAGVAKDFILSIDHTSTKDSASSSRAPLTAITSKARHVRVAALLKHFTGVVGQDLRLPCPAITARDHNALMDATLVEAAHIQRDFGNSVGQTADAPLGTIMPGGGGKAAVVTSHLVRLKGTCKDGQSNHEPLGAIQAQGNHYGEVRAFLMKYYATGAIGQGLGEPIHTIRAGDTFALVTIKGVDYQIVDIGMRMLQPHELYACQGFPAGYEHEHVVIDGKKKRLKKEAQVRMVGNSVPPGMAAAFVRANVPLWALEREEAIAA